MHLRSQCQGDEQQLGDLRLLRRRAARSTRAPADAQLRSVSALHFHRASCVSACAGCLYSRTLSGAYGLSVRKGRRGSRKADRTIHMAWASTEFSEVPRALLKNLTAHRLRSLAAGQLRTLKILYIYPQAIHNTWNCHF